MPGLQSARPAELKYSGFQTAFCHEISHNATPVRAADAARFRVMAGTRDFLATAVDDM
jgi:hypothetical protein